MRISHVVCVAPLGAHRNDIIRVACSLALATGIEVRVPFNGEEIIAVAPIDRPPTVAESLRAFINECD